MNTTAASKIDKGERQSDSDDALLTTIRLSQDFAEVVGVEKVLLTVPIRKPNRDEFFRVHPDPSNRIDTLIVELKTERELCVVLPAVASVVAEFTDPVRLFLCVSRQGTVFLWPAKLPKGDRRGDDWRKSALEAAGLAERHWIRISADMHLGAYQPFRSQADLGEPKWPDKSFAEILKIAVRDRIVDTVDHPLVRQLLGAV